MFKNPLFCIFTGNRFNQVLIFPSWDAAAKWARSATTWTEKQIEKNIRIASPIWTGCGFLSASE